MEVQATTKNSSSRVSKACDQCSRFRRRCDGNLPCQLCLDKNRTCVYSRITKKRGPEAKKLQKLKTEVMELTKRVEIAMATGVSHWGHAEFLKLKIKDKQGRILSLVDLYFAKTYISLPILSRQWIIDNFVDIPLHLLHSMYISAVTATDMNTPSNLEKAVKHAKYLKKLLYSRTENVDPFVIVSFINLAYYEFSSAHKNASLSCIAIAVKLAQILGLDKDKHIQWRSESTGRILGTDFGLDKQFLRSIWFLLYLWDNNNQLMFGVPTLISVGIPDEMILTYVSPNVGDSSNIPQNFLTHNFYLMPLVNLGKLAISAVNAEQCFQLLHHFDAYYASMPISYQVLTPIWLGRTINWINELYHYYRFKILISLFLLFKDSDKSDVREFIQVQIMASINTTVIMANAFLSFFNGEIQRFGLYFFFSKVLNTAAISYCVVGPDTIEGLRKTIFDQLVNGIRLSGTPQDYEVLDKCYINQDFAVDTLDSLFSHLVGI